MTISQALRRIKKLKGDLSTHLERAASGVSYKAGKQPAFTWSSSIELAQQARDELIQLETRVALTNAQTRIELEPVGAYPSMTLTEATKRLRELKSEIDWHRNSVLSRDHAEMTDEERSFDYDTEKHVTRQVTWHCDMPAAKKAEAVARLQMKFDRLNDAVESANHRTEIVSL